MLDRWINQSTIITTGTTGIRFDKHNFFLKEKVKPGQLLSLILNSDEGYIEFMIEKRIPQQNTHYFFKH